jgi:trk system potassium uptake protein TrkH
MVSHCDVRRAAHANVIAVRRTLQHPARIVPIAFLLAIAAGTVLLVLPVSRAGAGGHAPPLTALFTATSAVCVAGFGVVDTPTYWSGFGHLVIMLLMQVGGLGIMTMATLLGLLVSRRLRLGTRLVAQVESRALALGDVRGVLLRIAVTVLVIEAAGTVVLGLRFWLGYDYPVAKAAWHGLFHTISAFNNCGFALYSASMSRFVGDWWICLTLAGLCIAGGIGFPVLFELRREWRSPRTWSAHTRIVLSGTAILLAAGFVAMLAFEWSNPRTFGPLGVPGKILAAFFQGTMPRSAGLQSVDFGAMHLETTTLTDTLMFIGGGSAGTAGGIKVSTFFLLAYVIWSEVMGERDVVVGRRRMAEATQRQALAVALLGVGAVATGTLALIVLTEGVRLDQALFECISAFGTVGLSLNITPSLPGSAQVVLIMLMYVGRVGTITVATALALRTRHRRYRYAEERPIVG